jgi:hypothetical protein
MDWRSGSSGKEPLLQAQSPKFKHQSHQNNPKNKTKQKNKIQPYKKVEKHKISYKRDITCKHLAHTGT